MLTDPMLSGHVANGKLKLWESAPGVPVRAIRTLLLTPEVHDEVYRADWPREPEDRSNADARERRRSFHAITGKFVGGGLMAPDEEIRLLNPGGDPSFTSLFEFRSGPPRPQSRLFAHVFAPGVWIGTVFRLRSQLGDGDDPRWLGAAQAACAKWGELFPGRAFIACKHPCNTFAKLKAVSDAK